MVAITNPETKTLSSIWKLQYLKVLKQPKQLNSLTYSPNLLTSLLLGGSDLISATKYPEIVNPRPRA